MKEGVAFKTRMSEGVVFSLSFLLLQVIPWNKEG